MRLRGGAAVLDEGTARGPGDDSTTPIVALIPTTPWLPTVASTAPDDAAFAVLVRDYSRQVFGIALRMLGDRAEAEDVTQDVFLICWRKIDGLADPQAVGGWLCRIAQRRALEVLRARRRRRTEPYAQVPESAMISGLGVTGRCCVQPERAAETSAALRDLGCAVRTLTAPQRVVWLLIEVAGISHAEAARLLDLDEQAVRGRLCRARSRLAVALRAWR
ncbi:RNA polymerase sigma-70 factor (ECF subfamily) [Actinoalloteichus hymeniacidonis]|uniref:RNA polymerase sigma factor n=1 Tax=Actinoalloteichus hymeniacidonis TaxID=340345 RepID=UPI0017EF737F|nr:sigma-70 family RNA polymerase sigma factor [Actinoalloteichus hymeniacidonis]MBB5910986.1 RNA polymerase sigma-70 factor (ECF subfamily) [Actinoalloteichus hymeniacidonis]